MINISNLYKVTSNQCIASLDYYSNLWDMLTCLVSALGHVSIYWESSDLFY